YPALISCEEIVKASNDGPVILKFNQFTLEVIIPSYRAFFLWLYNTRLPVYPALISCEEIVKAGNDGPVILEALL
ncbi:9256_t:CDS:1, partial [Funneliformis caledonium]